MEYAIILCLALFLTGFLYSSVGHGGASGYIAVLSLFSIPILTYKPMILILNILIAGIGFYQFHKEGHFRWKLCRIFLITSIPGAFLGSQYPLEDNIYHYLLGIALILPILKLFGIQPSEIDPDQARKIKIIPALFIGLLIGLFSGMLNIGGGIFLSPILLLLGWANLKQAAATSALFIVLNSLSGLIGSAETISVTPSSATWFIFAALGGLTGSYFGSKKFQLATLRYLLTLVLSIASIKLIFFM